GSIDPLRGAAAGLLVAALIGFVLVVLLSRASLAVAWPVRRTAFAVLAALPLVAALLALRWLHPEPGPLLSLGALSAGAVYVLAVQVRLFASALAVTRPVTPES